MFFKKKKNVFGSSNPLADTLDIGTMTRSMELDLSNTPTEQAILASLFKAARKELENYTFLTEMSILEVVF
jgi:hypothetical protein